MTKQEAKEKLERLFDLFLLGELSRDPFEWECRQTIAGLLLIVNKREHVAPPASEEFQLTP